MTTDEEVLLIIKTRSCGVEALTRAVRELHSYDEPEIIALPVVGGSESYLRWVTDSSGGAAA